MPVSAVVCARVERDTVFAPGIARALHAWLLDRIRQEDAKGAARLHDGSRLKPITVSPIQGAVSSVTPGWVRVVTGTPLWFRCTALNPEAEQLLVQSLDIAKDGTLDVGGLCLGGLTVHTEEQGHPWAGTVSYQGLFDSALAAPSSETLVMRSYSPTTFRTQEGNLPFPLPALFFRTLIEKWNRFSPIDFGSFLTAFEERVRVQSYQCQSHRMHFGRFSEVGFSGTVTFDLRHLEDPLLAKVARCLGAYAFYGGVGAKTTMGFGQSRMVT